MNKRYLIILIISLILFLGLVLITLISNPEQSNNSSTIPNYTPPQTIINTITKEQLIEKLPIQTSGYNIEYLAPDDMILITIKEEPTEQYQQQSEQWLREQGVYDFELFNIKWIVESYLRNLPVYQ